MKRNHHGDDMFSPSVESSHATHNNIVPFYQEDSPLSETDIEKALQRLHKVVQDEPVHEAWLRPEVEFQTSDSVGRGLIRSQLNDSDDIEIEQPANMLGKDNAHKPQSPRQRLRNRQTIWRSVSGLVAAGVIAMLIVTPIGNQVMAGAMQTLYFHNVAGVEQNDFAKIGEALSKETDGHQRNVSLKQYGSIDVSSQGQWKNNVTVKQASNMAGLPPKALPGFNPNGDFVQFAPAFDYTFHLHVRAINQLIHQLGGKTEFPMSVDNQPIIVHIPAQFEEDVSRKGYYQSLTMLKMPSVQVPSGTDLNQVRRALIDLPFMPSDMRNQLLKSENWTSTLWMPVTGKPEKATIGGYQAIIAGDGNYMMITWVEDGVLYTLSESAEKGVSKSQLVGVAKGLAK